MGIAQTTSAVIIFLTGLLPASCHKGVPQQQSGAGTVSLALTNAAGQPAALPAADRILGDVTLTNHNETCLRLATGETCTLTPRMLDQRNVQLTLAVESKNDYGETHNFAVTQIVTESGKTLQVAVGDLDLIFTPRVTEE